MATATATGGYVLLRDLMREVLEGRDYPVDLFVRDYFGGDAGAISVDPWSGLARVPEKVAFQVREDHLRGKAREQALRSAFAEYLGERNGDKQEAADRAFDLESRVRKLEAPRDLRVPGLPLGTGWASITMNGHPLRLDNPMEVEHAREALEHARAAAQEARQRFDERHPELTFAQWVKRHGTGVA